MEQLLKATDLAGVTRLLIMQPTAFCNVDCDYCYLPLRSDRRIMSHDTVAAATRFVFEASLQARDFTVVWHAGEPLVVPPSWYAEAFARVAAQAPLGVCVPHAIQTNGMLINDAWCDLFLAHNVRVGVSIDGPAFLHDARRRTRLGSGTHAAALKGLRLLKARGVPLHVICVITNASLGHARELMEFYRDEGITDIGFNIEEVEGANVSSTLARPGVIDDFRTFFETVLEESENADPNLRVREYRNVLAMLRHPGLGTMTANSQNMPFAMVTVSVGGELFTFSPELAGLSDENYNDYIVGRLPDATLESVLSDSTFQKLWGDIWQGITRCRESCAYFALCLGGAPVNKMSECGTFIATETLACKLAQQVVADVSLSRLERSLQVAVAP
ncbi:cyclophane-forming radical SAM/SPASM peptide maturase GrrM/OscB [Rhizobium leguminosarum]|uniref:cyclophane-forming radical SAM/SPASM peptide maturase GrrM/OscB n=1 Tax=Rhizobium leguminosarum TaxID=384 RepID=UPI0012FAC51D|nr:cyclophane-forming radical SAM/SPASM peptide maturase GrrM/OscB [Rhizobium leguminosarum]MVO95496.1 GRRM system radical SAM/SPASM domain protein [Rhizobium leguminosarum bv. phaseoli]